MRERGFGLSVLQPLARTVGESVERSEAGEGRAMIAYAIRRILLIIPTLFAIMVVNFVIVQAAPGGPVEQMISRLKGSDVSATERVSGGTGEFKTQTGASDTRYRGARGLVPAPEPRFTTCGWKPDSATAR